MSTLDIEKDGKVKKLCSYFIAQGVGSRIYCRRKEQCIFVHEKLEWIQENYGH